MKCKCVVFDNLGDVTRSVDTTVNALYENSICREANMYWSKGLLLETNSYFGF